MNEWCSGNAWLNAKMWGVSKAWAGLKVRCREEAKQARGSEGKLRPAAQGGEQSQTGGPLAAVRGFCPPTPPSALQNTGRGRTGLCLWMSAFCVAARVCILFVCTFLCICMCVYVFVHVIVLCIHVHIWRVYLVSVVGLRGVYICVFMIVCVLCVYLCGFSCFCLYLCSYACVLCLVLWCCVCVSVYVHLCFGCVMRSAALCTCCINVCGLYIWFYCAVCGWFCCVCVSIYLSVFLCASVCTCIAIIVCVAIIMWYVCEWSGYVP